MRGYIKKTLLILLILLNSNLNILSQSSVIVPDGDAPRGFVSNILVQGTIPGPVAEITIKFRYNALLLDIKKITGGPDFAFTDGEINFDNNMTILDSAILTISGLNVQPVENGTICVVELEGLAGPDSIAIFEPVEMLINGEEPGNIDYLSGILTIGDPVFQRFPENLGSNYPNPFNFNTKFPFSINKKTKVKFYIYSLDGNLVQEIPHPSPIIEYYFFDSNGKPMKDALSNGFERGKYEIELIPVNWKVAKGIYFMIMETSKKVYHRTFIFMR